jgi:hypothetical protein
MILVKGLKNYKKIKTNIPTLVPSTPFGIPFRLPVQFYNHFQMTSSEGFHYSDESEPS